MSIIKAVKKAAVRLIYSVPVLDRALLDSAGYRILSEQDSRSQIQLLHGWHSTRSVERQKRAYGKLIADLRRGKPRIDFEVAAEAVKSTGLFHPSLLEIGCGNGYYCEVFQYLVPGLRYTGLDYSEAMVRSAQNRYPSDSFRVGDATKLADADGAFEIVFNGVSLMHILEYKEALKEAARVASRFLILHGVPVFDDHKTTFFRKYAYGEPVIEIVFSRGELETLIGECGFGIQKIWPSLEYDVYKAAGAHSRSLTFLAERR